MPDEYEQRMFAKAKKVKWENYEGPVVAGDTFYNDVECFLDENQIEDTDDEDCPEYVWGCEKADVFVDATNIVEDILSGYEENPCDPRVDKAIDALQRSLNRWVKKHMAHLWDVDFFTAVLLKE